VTLEFAMNCSELVEKLMATQTNFHSHKYEEVGEDLIGFKMITENATEVSCGVCVCLCVYIYTVDGWYVHDGLRLGHLIWINHTVFTASRIDGKPT